jgi:hypothetical protein
MTTRKFLTSVADVYGYDSSDTIVFSGKTLLDSSIEVSLGSAPVRGGRGNQLQYIYYHTGEMKFTITDTQWNLFMLGATVGDDPLPNNNVYIEEDLEVVVSSQTVTGTVSATPLAFGGATKIYGWITLPNGNTYKGEFTGKAFTATKTTDDVLATGQHVCIRFYAADADSVSVTVEANMIPKVVKLVMETQLNSADVTTNKIGMVQIIAPTVTLSGAFTISMKADGVANTPLTATALAYNDTSGTSTTPCSLVPYYAKIIEIIDDANWYDNVIGLSVEGGDFSLGTGDTATLSVWAVPSSGAAFKPPTSALTFARVSGDISAVSTTGIVTASATSTGTAVVTVCITAVTSIDSTVVITLTA